MLASAAQYAGSAECAESEGGIGVIEQGIGGIGGGVSVVSVIGTLLDLSHLSIVYGLEVFNLN